MPFQTYSFCESKVLAYQTAKQDGHRPFDTRTDWLEPHLRHSADWFKTLKSRQELVAGDAFFNAKIDTTITTRPNTTTTTTTTTTNNNNNKKAELPQRWPHDAPYNMGALKIFESPWVGYAHDYFSRIFNGLLFRSIVRMCVQNLKFVALPVPEIIGGTLKHWAVPGYAHATFSQKI